MSVSPFTGCVHPHKVGFSSRPRTRDNISIPDIVACFAVSVGVHPFALRSAAIVLLVLLCLLHCCAVVRCCVTCTAVRASPHLCLLSRLRLRPPVSAFLAVYLLLNALCGAFILPLSLSLNLSSQARLSSARGLQHWTGRLYCCFAGTRLDITLDLTWNLLDHLHLSLCQCILRDVLIASSGNGVCSASSVSCNVCVWRYSGITPLLPRQRYALQ